MKKKEAVRKALLSEYALLAYNVLEAIASVFFGLAAGSIALIGFGLDSIVESMSTVILIDRLGKHGKVSEEKEEEHEKRALRLVGYMFYLLAAYVAFESARKLLLGQQPEATLPGAVIAVLSIIIMPFFARYNHQLGHEMGSHALIADSKQTQLCAYMSVALLIGIGLNYLFGFWWADPLAGLVIAGLAVQEGRRALSGEMCC